MKELHSIIFVGEKKNTESCSVPGSLDTRVILTRPLGALHRFPIEVGQLALVGRPALLGGSQGSLQRGELPPRNGLGVIGYLPVHLRQRLP